MNWKMHDSQWWVVKGRSIPLNGKRFTPMSNKTEINEPSKKKKKSKTTSSFQLYKNPESKYKLKDHKSFSVGGGARYHRGCSKEKSVTDKMQKITKNLKIKVQELRLDNNDRENKWKNYMKKLKRE